MSRRVSDSEAWRALVLGSMPPAAWLSSDGSNRDVVLSTRFRIMRNLRGHRFPHRAPPDELVEIKKKVVEASGAKAGYAVDCPALELFEAVSPAERQFFVGSRLVSPDFEWREPGRALLMDRDRSIGIMVNEEDHIRLQAISGGWSPASARKLAGAAIATLAQRLEFAASPRFGFLAASPYNSGAGVRESAMFHLIGLAHSGKLPAVLRALAARGIATRGIFGESSRAVGAYVQVSSTTGSRDEFAGACAYLIQAERAARASVTAVEIEERARLSARHAQTSRELSQPEALRVLAWLRWAATSGIALNGCGAREIDRCWALIELRGSADEASASRQRAEFLRARFGL